MVFDTRDFLEKAWEVVEKVRIDGARDNRFRGAMLYSALNICDAMQLLIQKRNFVSANILFRALFEYVFRAYWLNRQATSDQIALAIEEDDWPRTKFLHESIEGHSSEIDALVAEKLKVQDILHSYIHGGSQNPLGQFGSMGHIEPNIADSEVAYLLHVVQLSTYIIVAEMIYLSDSTELEADVAQMVEDLING